MLICRDREAIPCRQLCQTSVNFLTFRTIWPGSIVQLSRRPFLPSHWRARKRSPWTLGPAQYRDDVEKLRGLFAELIGVTADDISFGPSASYCLSTAAQNLTIEPGSRIVVLADQFPSHVYPWRYVTARDGGELITVPRPEDGDWARAVLDVLDERVAVLALPQHHWTDGGLVDLERIAPVARSCGAALVLDLSQTIGAVPVDVRQLQPDFLC